MGLISRHAHPGQLAKGLRGMSKDCVPGEMYRRMARSMASSPAPAAPCRHALVQKDMLEDAFANVLESWES
jgi:hypothetical protein